MSTISMPETTPGRVRRRDTARMGVTAVIATAAAVLPRRETREEREARRDAEHNRIWAPIREAFTELHPTDPGARLNEFDTPGFKRAWAECQEQAERQAAETAAFVASLHDRSVAA